MKLLHLSFNGNLPTYLNPRQPNGTELSNRMVEDLPDRVSFAPTIKQCLLAIQPNITDVLNKSIEYGGFTIWLYEGLPDKETKYIPKKIVLEKVSDAKLTDEICVTTPIKIKKIGKVFVKTKLDKDNKPVFNGYTLN
jgi:hypothetical protein|nr:MAG TPA: hypothetical protein [Caudoviricetes sp.]